MPACLPKRWPCFCKSLTFHSESQFIIICSSEHQASIVHVVDGQKTLRFTVGFRSGFLWMHSTSETDPITTQHSLKEWISLGTFHVKKIVIALLVNFFFYWIQYHKISSDLLLLRVWDGDDFQLLLHQSSISVNLTELKSFFPVSEETKKNNRTWTWCENTHLHE